jgi:glyoxylase-like metal-dependent hydrolase (beta-lactamase superfamily II)
MHKPIAENWFAVDHVGDGVSRIYEPHMADWLRCNIWHVRGRDRDLVIDTGMGVRPLLEEITSLTERPVTAIVTHSHFDHSGGLYEFKTRCCHPIEAEIMAAPTPHNTVADTGYVRAEAFSALPFEGFRYEDYIVRPAPITDLLDEGDVIDLGDRVFQVFHLPGHSPGSIALYEKSSGLLFSGDVVYDGELLDDLFHSNADHLAQSLRRLKELPVHTVHAGHYQSFGQAQMIAIIDEYLAGGRRAGDIEDWIQDELSKTDE